MKRRHYTPNQQPRFPVQRLSFFERVDIGHILEDKVDERQWVVVGKSDYAPHARYQNILTVAHKNWRENPILAHWATCQTHDDCIESISGMGEGLPANVRDSMEDVRLFYNPFHERCRTVGAIDDVLLTEEERAIRGNLALTEIVSLYKSPYKHQITAHVLCAHQDELALKIGLSYVEEGARCPTLVMRPASTVINHFQHCRR